jgi:protein ImuA
VHEWFGVGDGEDEARGQSEQDGQGAPRGRRASPRRAPLRGRSRGGGASWTPPSGDDDGAGGLVAWIGRALWPHPRALPPGDRLLARSIFVDPPDDAGRLWSIDLALRCPAFAAVIADGRGLKMAQSRRLQLAAAQGGALALIARPPVERDELSAAATRWQVSFLPSRGEGPRWQVTLARCKTPVDDAGAHLPRSWMLEQDRDEGVVRLHAEVADRSDPAPASSEGAPQGCAALDRRQIA